VTIVRRHPLIAYYVLAVAFSIALALLLNVSLVFGLLALFGPATAAFIVARVTDGRAGVSALWSSIFRWRVHPAWYAAAVALPLIGFALGHVLYVAAGNEPLAVPGTVDPILLVLFVLVIGEEIGWRGFLLPGLLRDRSPLTATAIVAVAWAAWHSPLYFIPGMPSYGESYLALVAWVVVNSVLLTWLWLGTRSVLLATIMHGSMNLAGSVVFPLTDPGALFGFAAAGSVIVGIALLASSWRRFTEPLQQAEAPMPVAETAVG
jgi:membrane protease YdiL (CAAX protease family)